MMKKYSGEKGKRPDYSLSNEILEQEKKFHHPEGSLEAIAQNLVRTFEMVSFP
jgi:hypothetical protein